jgi:hypothetical protein
MAGLGVNKRGRKKTGKKFILSTDLRKGTAE